MKRPWCPDPNELAAFVDGNVDGARRRRLALHLDRCPECRSVLVASSEFLHEERSQPPLLGPRGRRAAAVIAILFVVGSLVGFFEHGTSRSEPSTTVAETLGDYRPIRPRLTGFRYAAYSDATRSVERSVRLAEDLRRAASAFPVTRSLATEASAENLHETALVHLVLDHRNRAVRALEVAARDTESRWPPARRARLLSDLAAALLGDWEEADDPVAPILALDAAGEALALVPELPEALFNRALALEALSLHRTAAEAWRAYLQVDPRSGWAEEARTHLAALGSEPGPDWASDRGALLDAAAGGDAALVELLVERHRQRARILVQDELLPAWGKRFPDGDWREPLVAAEAITEALTRQTGDLLLHRTIERIEETLVADPDAADLLARGHAAFGRGRVAFEQLRITEAETALRNARRDLENAASPFVLWARDWELACAHQRGEGIDAIGPSLAEIEEGARGLHAHALLGRALWLRGLAEVVSGDVARGSLAYREAAGLFSLLGELHHHAFLEFLVGEATMLLGDEATSWDHRHEALAQVPKMAHRPKAASILHGSAVAALAAGAPRAALALVSEILDDPALEDRIALSETRLLQARILRGLGRTAGAADAMDSTRALVSKVADPVIASRLDAKQAIAEAVLPSNVPPEDTLRRLSRAIEGFEEDGMTFHLPELYLARARARLRLGQIDSVQRDATAAFALLRKRAPSGPTSFWMALMEPRRVVGELVGGVIDAGDPDRAFRIAESARSFYPEAPGSSESRSETPSPEVVRSLLSSEEAFVFLARHDDSITAWVSTSTRERIHTLEISRSRIERRIGGLLEDLSHQRWGAQSRRIAEEIYEEIVKPISEMAPGTKRWIVSATGPLDRLPYSVLVNSSTGEFLIEELEIVTIPNTESFVRARGGDDSAIAGRLTSPDSILAVGNPEHDSRLFPRLRPLPGAETEARQVASLYREAELLTGFRATETVFERRAALFDVIHVAAHALNNPPGLLRSSVLLAPDPIVGDTGTLFAEEIAQLALPRARVVVLSGCRTARGEPGAGHQGNLARAFLAAGAEATIASLWDLDDTSTVKLSVELHRRLAAGATPSAALREAQLELLSSGDSSPWVWGAFQVSGG